MRTSFPFGTSISVASRRAADVTRLGIGAITHRLCRLIWKMLHQGIRYEDLGEAVGTETTKVRERKFIRELRSYRVLLLA